MSLIDNIVNIDETLASKILPRWAERVTRSIMKNFDAEGRPDKWDKSQKESGKTLAVSSKLRNSFSWQIKDRTVTWGTNLIYAAIHNFGGTVRPKVTPKMRKFAWAKWYETEDDKWKGLALTVKTKLEIKLPKRQYAMIQDDDITYLNKLISEVMNG